MNRTNTKATLRAKLRWGIAGIFALLLLTGIFNMPAFYNRSMDWLGNHVGVALPKVPEKPFRLGLDLRGGVHLVYKADTSELPAGEESEAISGARDVIDRRVNGMGVGETNIQTTKVGNEYRLIVDLPGVTDVKQAIDMIGKTPILEFKEPNTELPRELTAEEKKKMEEYNVDAKKRAEEALKRTQTDTESFEDIAKQISEDSEERKNNGGYIGFIISNEISEPIYKWAQTAKEGDKTSELIENSEGYNIVKRGKEQEGQFSVEASHILLCHNEVAGCPQDRTKEEAEKLANELYNKATARNFAQLAKDNSDDLSNKDKGGVLNAFPRGIMEPSFEEAAFRIKPGEIIGPVETPYGYHIIYKTGEGAPKQYEINRILIRKVTERDILPQYEQWKGTGLTGKQLEKAEVVTNSTGDTLVSLQFDQEGTELFKQLTQKHLNGPIAIFLDGEAISAPTVEAVVTNGQAVITGSRNLQEASELAKRLNTGALPVPVELISQQTIGPTLGAETLAASLRAATVAFGLIMLFMVLYYRLPGLIAVFALSLYASLTLSFFKLAGVTLTLSGIAGLVLSIGMAVDANILIFERMREELGRGKSLKLAIEEGFNHAWTAIKDGNISTIITCLLLLGFGTGFVQGFSITLIVGIIVNLFTAIVVTRVLLRFITPWFKSEGSFLFLGSRKK